MKKICVIQHTEAEYLGLMEDHFEGRNIRFIYKRPFAAGGSVPADIEDYDGLMLLGGGPYGLVSGPLLPSFRPELALTKAYLAAGLPVIGIGLGALVLTTALGGGIEEAPLRFSCSEIRSTEAGRVALALPESFFATFYLRDRPLPPDGAEVLATDADGRPVAYRAGGTALALLFHPGAKRGMVEDLIMEYEETPEGTVESLADLGAAQAEIAETLSSSMPGICRLTGLI